MQGDISKYFYLNKKTASAYKMLCVSVACKNYCTRRPSFTKKLRRMKDDGIDVFFTVQISFSLWFFVPPPCSLWPLHSVLYRPKAQFFSFGYADVYHKKIIFWMRTPARPNFFIWAGGKIKRRILLIPPVLKLRRAGAQAKKQFIKKNESNLIATKMKINQLKD